MDTRPNKLLVNDLGAMVAFYKRELGAELQDLSDLYACLTVGDNVIEMMYGNSDTTALFLQFSTFDEMSECCDKAKNHMISKMRSQATNHQTTYRAEFEDIEQNRIVLLYHHLFVPEHIEVD